MILEACFILGLITGLVTALILFLIIFRDNDDDFEKRQKKYRKMI